VFGHAVLCTAESKLYNTHARRKHPTQHPVISLGLRGSVLNVNDTQTIQYWRSALYPTNYCYKSSRRKRSPHKSFHTWPLEGLRAGNWSRRLSHRAINILLGRDSDAANPSHAATVADRQSLGHPSTCGLVLKCWGCWVDRTGR